MNEYDSSIDHIISFKFWKENNVKFVIHRWRNYALRCLNIQISCTYLLIFRQRANVFCVWVTIGVTCHTANGISLFGNWSVKIGVQLEKLIVYERIRSWVTMAMAVTINIPGDTDNKSTVHFTAAAQFVQFISTRHSHPFVSENVT